MNKLSDLGNESPSDPIIEARSVGKIVPGPDHELTLLKNINFTVRPGQSVAITGPSGSGKSTLLGLLAGLDVPSSGKILLEGKPFSELGEDDRAVRRGQICAFVFQHFHLVNDLSTVENVMLPLELQGLSDAHKQAENWLERVGLGHRLRHFPTTLSGGEQQRVALARAFSVKPRLLFADEPTGSLDHANGKQICDLLFDLNQDAGTALILVTHDQQLARRCQIHLRLEEGQLFTDNARVPEQSPLAEEQKAR
jgi:putative ABC transport system ATP-binding protein